MAIKAFFAAAALAAILVGLALPTPNHGSAQAQGRSQFSMIEIGHS